jgi:hypothetical protein
MVILVEKMEPVLVLRKHYNNSWRWLCVNACYRPLMDRVDQLTPELFML